VQKKKNQGGRGIREASFLGGRRTCSESLEEGEKLDKQRRRKKGRIFENRDEMIKETRLNDKRASRKTPPSEGGVLGFSGGLRLRGGAQKRVEENCEGDTACRPSNREKRGERVIVSWGDFKEGLELTVCYDTHRPSGLVAQGKKEKGKLQNLQDLRKTRRA